MVKNINTDQCRKPSSLYPPVGVMLDSVGWEDIISTGIYQGKFWSAFQRKGYILNGMGQFSL